MFIVYWVQGLSIACELEDKIGEGVVHNNMGMTYEMLNSLEQAQEHYEKVCDVLVYAFVCHIVCLVVHNYVYISTV